MIETGFAEFVWIWNRQQAQATPRLHLQIARWLAVRWQAGERELLLLAFRSSGKSTLVGLFCAWLLSQNPDLRILVLAGDFALAKKMVRNVKRIIERHPLTASLKPAHTDHWASDQFTVKRRAELRDPSMLAKGIGANITGLRADVVICDDVEVPNTCDTPPKRADLRARLRELEYVVVPGGLQVFVGTPHTYYSIYADQPRPEIGEAHAALAGFHRLEVPLLDEQGRCRWPERFAPARIEAIRRRTGPAKFDSQMMLRPRSIVEGRLDPERLRVYDADLRYTEGNHEARLALADRGWCPFRAGGIRPTDRRRRATPASSPSYSPTIRAVTGCIACGTCGTIRARRMLSTRQRSSAAKWRISPAICICRRSRWKPTV